MKARTLKRLLSVLLVACMFAGLLPVIPTASAAAGENLIENGGFESGFPAMPTGGWQTFSASDAAPKLTTAYASDGVYALQLTKPVTSNNSGRASCATPYIMAAANDPYTMEFDIRSDAANTISIYLWNGSSTAQVPNKAVTTSWQTITVPITTGWTKWAIILRTEGAAQDGVPFYIDNVKIYQNSDGSKTNLLTNGSFENDAVPSGWNTYAATEPARLWPGSSEIPAQEGSFMLRIKQPAGNRSALATPFISVNAGEKYMVKFWARSESGSALFTIYDWTNKNNTSDTNASTSTVYTATTQWQEFTREITIPAGRTQLAELFYSRNEGQVVYIDNVRIFSVNEEYILAQLNTAIDAQDAAQVNSCLHHSALALTGVDAYINQYLAALTAAKSEKGSALTRDEVQAVITGVNDAMENTLQALTIANNGFEIGNVGEIPDGWSAFRGTELIAAEAYAGNQSMVLTKAAVGDPSVGARSSRVFVSAGTEVYAEAMIKGNGSMNIYMESWNSASGGNPTNQIISTHGASGTWSRICSTMTIPAGSTYFGFLPYMSGGCAGSIYVDEVQVFIVNAALTLRNMNLGIAENDESFFIAWATHAKSAVTDVAAPLATQYMTALRAAYADKGGDLTAEEIQAVIKRVNSQNKSYLPVDIGTQLELFVEDTLIDPDSTAELVLQQPEAQELAIQHNDAWENMNSLYHTIMEDDGVYRMYYRGLDRNGTSGMNTICYAESTDGVNWTKPDLDIYTFNGSGDNNIILAGADFGATIECFYAFKDTNPLVTADARYKGLLTVRGCWHQTFCGKCGNYAYALKSSDGIHWSVMNGGAEVVSFRGTASNPHGGGDSHNVVFWNEETSRYEMYFRVGLHDDSAAAENSVIRAVGFLTSDNFLSWGGLDDAVILSEKYYWDAEADNTGYYGADPSLYQVYTNGTTIYDRAPHLTLATPTRYLNSACQVAPYFAASRDGETFKWWNTMLIPPEGDRSGNRANYAMTGLVRTSDTEYSMYASEGGYTLQKSDIRRFTFRVDGFVAAVGGADGDILLTKPVRFSGDHLILNYDAATAGGTVRAQLVDLQENPIEGFTFDDCVPLTGDAIAEELVWTGGDLNEIAGKNVKIMFELTNASLYSYMFAEGTPDSFNKTSASRITGVESTRLNWESADSALSYKITVATDAALTENVRTFTSLANFVDVTGLDAAESYYWSVEALGAVGSVTVGKPAQKPAAVGTVVTTPITNDGKTLADAKLTGTFTNAIYGTPVEGSLTWIDASGKTLPDSTVVEKNTAYMWRFVPDHACYAPTTGAVTLYGETESREIAMSQTIISANPGDADVQLNVSIDPADENAEVIWTSADETVATVDETGLVTIVGIGTTYITATTVYGYAICPVVVTEKGSSSGSNIIYVPTDAEPGWKLKETLIEYIDGYPDGTFGPERIVTRGEMAQMLFNIIEFKNVTPEHSYTDIGGTWVDNPVGMLCAIGVLDDEGGKFNMNEPATRADFVEAMARILKVTGDTSLEGFTDTDGHALEGIFASFKAMGILDGYEDGSVQPEKGMTRAEMVTIINRAVGVKPESGASPWPDVPETHWACGHIRAATESRLK